MSFVITLSIHMVLTLAKFMGQGHVRRGPTAMRAGGCHASASSSASNGIVDQVTLLTLDLFALIRAAGW